MKAETVFWQVVRFAAAAGHAASHRSYNRAQWIFEESRNNSTTPVSRERARVDWHYRKAQAIRSHFYSLWLLDQAETKLDPTRQKFEEIVKENHLQ